MSLRLSLLLIAPAAVASGRRKLLEADLNYALDDFKANFHTRADSHFADDAAFRRRLFEHESSLPDGHPHLFLATLHDDHEASTDSGARLQAASGPRMVSVLGGDLLMHGDREGADSLRARPEVRRVVPLLPELKISPHFEKLLPPNATTISLNARLVSASAAGGGSLREVAAREVVARLKAAHASLCAEEGARKTRASCSGGGLAVRLESERTVVAEKVPVAEALEVARGLADEAAVLWIEPHAHYVTYNADAAQLTQSGSSPVAGPGGQPVGTTPMWSMGLHGEGEIIGVGDSGLDVGHCFFEQAVGQGVAQQTPGPAHRKVVNYRAYADGVATGPRDHGTHVVGSILGEAPTGVPLTDLGANEKGVAYKAKVSFTDIGPGDGPGLQVPNDLVNNFFNVDYNNGARIHSNSWGANVNAYTLSAADVDEFMHRFDDMLILFAAGNSGQEGPGSVGSPATCKNCLSVGASENDDPNPTPPRTPKSDGNVAFFSSQGPTASGNQPDRYKPDVVAPGFMVRSANSNQPAAAGDCPTTDMAGTSMATPVTAGDAALVRQYFRQGYYPSGAPNPTQAITPSGALMKAMIVQSGVTMTGSYQNAPLAPTPSNIQGFGRVQLNHVLFGADGVGGADKHLFFVDGGTDGLLTTTGTLKTFQINTRTPGATGSDALLGQELKVTLVYTDPAAQPLDATPLINNLDLKVEYSSAAGAPTTLWGNGVPNGDPKNNVEQVVFQLAAAAPSAPVTVTVQATAITQGPQRFALVVTGALDLAADQIPGGGNGGGGGIGGGGGNGINGPPSPPGKYGDAVALGLSLPLLALALAGGGCFAFRRRAPAPGQHKPGMKPQPSFLLPAGWKKLRDPSSGVPYFLNEATGQTQWEPPANVVPAPPPPPPPPNVQLPPDWITANDPATGVIYYYNTATGVSSWTPP